MNPVGLAMKQSPDFIGAGVAYGKPDHLGRCAKENGSLAEIVVLGNDCEPLNLRILPDCSIRRALQVDLLDVRRAGIRFLESDD